MQRLSPKTRFRIGSAGIILLFCSIVSVLIYYQLRSAVTERIHRETEIFIATADATRTYVKDVLRPRVGGLVAEESFIPEAMSTSYVGREIMTRLRDRFPDFEYKRAAGNPMNPINQADDFEQEMLDWFRDHPNRQEWHGVIRKDARSYYSRFRVIRAEGECLACHGRPIDAPEQLKALYGVRGGYGYKVGDVVAADTIYVPVDVSFVHIKETAWMVFIVAICSLLFFMALFLLLFDRTVVFELKGLLSTFRSIAPANREIPEMQTADDADEFQQVKGAFEQVAEDLKRTHLELRASETKYRLLFENSQDAIVIIDDQTGLADINPAGLALFGFRDLAEARSIETAFQLFWDTRDAEVFFETVRTRGFVRGREIAMVDREGRKLEVMVSASVRRETEEAAGQIEVMLRDVTDFKRLEKYLAQTEKLASLGQLAAGVAHEINNPLGVIKCYANLIRRQLNSESEVLSDVEVIQRHTDHCKSVVEALLSFARVSKPKMGDTDLNTSIEEVLSMIRPQTEKGRIEVKTAFSDRLPTVVADAQQMKQVIMNLLINAVQAMPDGGRIIVASRSDEEQRQVEVQITDTGAGIAEKNIGRIFDPFFTTKPVGKGTGLGLSIRYGIVSRHGGKITVDSKPGKGTTFTVRLPIDDPADAGKGG